MTIGENIPAVAQAESSRFDAYNTEDLWQKDLDHHIHPFTDFATWKEQGALVIAESEGAYVYDSDGRRYPGRHRRALVRERGIWAYRDRKGHGRPGHQDGLLLALHRHDVGARY